MKIAVVCAAGIGDALIMLIASHHLLKRGHTVTTFSRHLPGFGRWLEPAEYRPVWKDAFAGFDAVLLQHDNTAPAREVVSLRQSGLPVYVLYPTYRLSKHGALIEGFDFIFDANQTMVDNTCRAIATLFGGIASAENGLKPLPSLIHRKCQRRVLIHPTSASENKNWSKAKFLKLAKLLKNMSFQPVFLLSPEEKEAWPEVQAPYIPTLEDLASMIYESGYFIGNDSGPGHLASYLSIPHLIIRRREGNLPLWQPGWHRGAMLCPPRWLPNFKGFRLRDEKWQYFITTKGVLNKFISIVK